MSDVKPVAYELHKARPNGDPVFGFCSASEVHSYTEDHWDIHAPLYSQATIDALQAEIEAMRKDAERYKWLRSRMPGAAYRVEGIIYSQGGSGVDAGIDAAIAKEKQP